MLFRSLTAQAREGRTVILVTHDLELARKAERVLYLRDGRLIQVEETRPNPEIPGRAS